MAIVHARCAMPVASRPVIVASRQGKATGGGGNANLTAISALSHTHTHTYTHTYTHIQWTQQPWSRPREEDDARKENTASITRALRSLALDPRTHAHAHTHTYPPTQSASQHTLGMHSTHHSSLTHTAVSAVNVLLRGGLADEEMHLRDVKRRRACAHRAVFSKTKPPRGLSVGSAMAPQVVVSPQT
jgi:hypothetical protein